MTGIPWLGSTKLPDRWVLASLSSLTAPSLHKLTRRAPPLKYSVQQHNRHSHENHKKDTQMNSVFCDFPCRYADTSDKLGWCILDQSIPHRRLTISLYIAIVA